MESDNLNKAENTAAPTFLVQEDDDEYAFNTRPIAAAENAGIFYDGGSDRGDPLSFPYIPFSIAPFPWKHMRGTYQPYTHSIPETCDNLMIDLNQLHNSQNTLIDPNSINISSNIPSMYRPVLPFPEGSTKGVMYPCDMTGAADGLMIDSPHFHSLQNHEINRNVALIRGNAGGGYGMIRQGGEADGSNIHGPQIKNFDLLGGSKTMLCHPQNSGEINIDNHDQLNAGQFSSPEKIDGSFLSLGIGDMIDVKSKSDFSNREIAGKLDSAVSPQLNTSCVRQPTGNSLNPGHNLVSGFSSPGHIAGGWTSSNNNVGAVCGTNTGLYSSPFHILQKPQANMQHGFPKSSNRNLGFVGSRDSRYANLDPYKGFVSEQASSSGPISSRSGGLLVSGQTWATGLASESVKFTQTTSQPPPDQLQKRYMETVQNFSPESSRVSSFNVFNGNTTRQEHSGRFFPASEYSAAQTVDESAHLPKKKRVQPAGQLFSANAAAAPCASGAGLFSKWIGAQVSNDSAAQAADIDLFPQRLGVQVNEHGAARPAGDGLFPKSTSIQFTTGFVPYAAERGLYPNETGVQTASCSQGLPFQSSKDLLAPISTTGQVISNAKGYGLSLASNVLSRPSVKRSAIQPPFPTASRFRRRKIPPQPSILPSMQIPPQTAPAAAIPIPADVTHIKWQGADELPQPIGQKCMLCKRDLSFTPEGPVYQPTISPAVAVLPCGHTFHDHCLQLITPEDQSKDPPCIPCALGEI